jgi:hypothetical protein
MLGAKMLSIGAFTVPQLFLSLHSLLLIRPKKTSGSTKKV